VALRVADVEVGAFVRVLVAPASSQHASTWTRRHQGLFRVEPGGVRHNMQSRDWNRVVGFNRRSFTANVLVNDTVNRELRLSIEDPRVTKSTRLHYEVVLPYGVLMRLAVLVRQARLLTLSDELKFRRKYRRGAVNKQFFDPKDRFEAVQLV
jgi:hypothetical protein